MAILLIVALSAGFFAGLKITTDAMLHTGGEYFEEQNFYDFRLFSTLGFTEDNVKEFGKLKGVEKAEGTYSVDALMVHKDSDHPFKLYAISENVNVPSLSAGRMPTADNECMADEDVFTEEDIGKTISLADENDSSVTDSLERNEYTIVGLVSSPLHIGLDRGTTDIGNGSVYSFLYLPESNFKSEVYAEINLLLTDTAEIYSDEYDELIDTYEAEVTALCERLAEERYQDILDEKHLTAEIAEQMGITVPETYVLTRNENAGYVSFENDTGIIGLIGIGCCAGLVVTAFGVRDSMIDVGELQYGTIQMQDIEASFDEGNETEITTALDKLSGIEKYITVSSNRVDITAESSMNSVNLLSIKSDEEYSDFWDFHSGDSSFKLPAKGEVLISPKVAEKLELSAGDTFTIRNSDMVSGTAKVGGVFDNHIYDYVVMTDETYTELFGEWQTNTALILADGDTEALAKDLTETGKFTSVSQLDMMRANISDALDCLNYIIWLIIFFSGALAFIVIFNLTNINIAERSREIATVQVLGFYPKKPKATC